MKTASLADLKKELQQLPEKKLLELCVSVAKYKKDNKEYLAYLLFDAHDNRGFLKEVKTEVDELFLPVSAHANLYHTKKTLRKILRYINKYCKYTGDKAFSADLQIYFCKKLKAS